MPAPRVLALPDPSLVVLVGAAGAGKSTFAAQWFGADEVLSSDAFRLRIAGDESDMAITRVAFGVLHKALERRLAQGRLTVVDATNVERHARRALVTRALAAGIPAVAIVLALPAQVVHAQNALRPGRVVPRDVVEQHVRMLEHGLRAGALQVEGFAEVAIIRDSVELDALRVERAPMRFAASRSVRP
jgi:protein phosphatase